MHYYGKYFYRNFLKAPLNIVLYNIFSSHGPNLYGIEDIKYYLKNLVLNWNLVIFLAPFAVPFSCFAFVRTRSSRQLSQRVPISKNSPYSAFF